MLCDFISERGVAEGESMGGATAGCTTSVTVLSDPIPSSLNVVALDKFSPVRCGVQDV